MAKEEKVAKQKKSTNSFCFLDLLYISLTNIKDPNEALWCNNKIKIPVSYKGKKCYLSKILIEFWVQSRE